MAIIAVDAGGVGGRIGVAVGPGWNSAWLAGVFAVFAWQMWRRRTAYRALKLASVRYGMAAAGPPLLIRQRSKISSSVRRLGPRTPA